MSEQVLKGSVPVYIMVDDGVVTQVVVDDEEVKYDEDSDPKLIEAAEAYDLWPAWQFGW
ncbi:MAG TPA: hypothetical protein VLA89_02875 [Gemmatimonadales bacterium]|nr:hypothetical protein [Gemmatimonadales bacterium]